MNSGATIAKYLLFFINLVFAIAGLTFAGLGAYGIYYLKQAEFSDGNVVMMYPTMLLMVGLVMFMIAFCGCCGSIKEIKCLLIMYAIILVALAAVKIFFTVEVIQGHLENYSKEMVNATFIKSYEHFGIIEKTFECCGTIGGDSYRFNSVKLPPTCCKYPISNECSNADYKGCKEVIGGFIKDNSTKIAYAAIGMIAFEFLAVIFAICVTTAIGRGSYHY